MDINLYFLVILMKKPISHAHQANFRFSLESPLGKVTLCGFNRNTVCNVPKPFRLFGQYAIAYIIDGQGHYEDAQGISQKLHPGDCIFVFPDLKHRYGPLKNRSWTEFFLVFDGPVFKLWEDLGLLNPKQPIHHLEPIHIWLHKLESVLSSSRKTGVESPMIEICRLQLLLSEILLSKSQPMRDNDTSWASRACALLESDLQHELNLSAFAKQMNTSYDHFRKRFQKIIGIPPAQYRGRCLINRACEMISRGALTDKEIAEKLGFCDEFYFSRRFKEVTGLSPRAFRQNLLKKG
jgi:AraC-like DNA-binding protein